jgi:hypothetical protein
MAPPKQMQDWSDLELIQELERRTGDLERDVEREAIRRLVERMNTPVPREIQPF